MKKISIFALASFALLLIAFKPGSESVWTVDKSHARLGFSITHLMVSDVEGSFKEFDATITGTKEDFSDAVVHLTAETNSITTENDGRDEHIKGPDFLDVTKYSSLDFISTSFKKTGDKTYKVAGKLTFHGVTKPVELDATCNLGTNPMSKKTIAGFRISGKIKRSDFALAPTVPAAMLSDEVTINANTEFAKN